MPVVLLVVWLLARTPLVTISRQHDAQGCPVQVLLHAELPECATRVLTDPSGRGVSQRICFPGNATISRIEQQSLPCPDRQGGFLLSTAMAAAAGYSGWRSCLLSALRRRGRCIEVCAPSSTPHVLVADSHMVSFLLSPPIWQLEPSSSKPRSGDYHPPTAVRSWSAPVKKKVRRCLRQQPLWRWHWLLMRTPSDSSMLQFESVAFAATIQHIKELTPDRPVAHDPNS